MDLEDTKQLLLTILHHQFNFDNNCIISPIRSNLSTLVLGASLTLLHFPKCQLSCAHPEPIGCESPDHLLYSCSVRISPNVGFYTQKSCNVLLERIPQILHLVKEDSHSQHLICQDYETSPPSHN